MNYREALEWCAEHNAVVDTFSVADDDGKKVLWLKVRLPDGCSCSSPSLSFAVEMLIQQLLEQEIQLLKRKVFRNDAVRSVGPG